MLRRLQLRLRIWWHRREARLWYDDSIAHRRSANLHREAIWHCLANGNQHRDLANQMETQATESVTSKASV